MNHKTARHTHEHDETAEELIAFTENLSRIEYDAIVERLGAMTHKVGIEGAIGTYAAWALSACVLAIVNRREE